MSGSVVVRPSDVDLCSTSAVVESPSSKLLVVGLLVVEWSSKLLVVESGVSGVVVSSSAGGVVVAVVTVRVV